MSPKQALSVTLDVANITWLKGRAGAGAARSVSELLDRLVTTARQAGQTGSVRSVAGTIDINPSDPGLETADAALGVMYEASLGRPFVVREKATRYPARPLKKRRG